MATSRAPLWTRWTWSMVNKRKLHRAVVWVILANFDRLFAVVFIERCGHVGNALALSIMSTVMLRAHAMVVDKTL
jgi:hypothetical protein